ncbi:Six-hairpin glycosidase [Pseudovirgaria hyperparasitica]|uniref:Six-hairpin glycosidase n=1 Tax=Pseudovirgaria hyperparasitica TaxID=470096 RepID=A0A6A6W6Z8_9PEZI|nr:Six-hairpin glycosidase [Pseudovirgaria hyperparasitica]KAF2758658.1 Six-hairpin glycosidase [Pseudovirgaria hyperparasitica]
MASHSSLTASYLALLSLSSIIVSPILAQDGASTRARVALDALQTWYNRDSGIWDSCGWWNGANCMTVLADFAMLDPSVAQTANDVFSNTYVRAPAVNPLPGVEKVNHDEQVKTLYPDNWLIVNPDSRTGKAGQVDPSLWLDGYYDDDLWWALAWIAAYDVSGNSDYLATAEGIFQSTSKAWPTNCSDGGIPWNQNYTYVNAISNELFLDTAAHLANRAADKQYYVDWARKQWDWLQRSGMINSDGVFNDGLNYGRDGCYDNGQPVWSYNQGVILGGLVELNRASHTTYLDSADSIAAAAIRNLTDVNHVLHEPCEPDCAPDGTQFKGIFMRNLQLLHAARPKDLYAQVIQSSANSLWNSDRDSENKFSVSWTGPIVNPFNVASQVLVRIVKVVEASYNRKAKAKRSTKCGNLSREDRETAGPQ